MAASTSTTSRKEPDARKIIPCFKSSDILATIVLYRDHFHFNVGEPYPSVESAGFVSVSAGVDAAANIYLMKDATPSKAMIAITTVAALESYYTLLTADALVKVTSPIENMDWGYRQFSVKDNDENELTFFAFLDESL